MLSRPSPCATCSGFRKKDVYEELRTALQHSNHERACAAGVELFCTHNEAMNVAAFLLDHYALHKCNSCLPTLQQLEQYVATLVNHVARVKASKAPPQVRARPWLDSACRKALMTLVMFVACLPSKNLAITADLALASETPPKNDPSHRASGAMRILLDDLAQVRAQLLPDSLLCVLNRLAAQTCDGNSVRLTMANVACIIRVHPLLPSVSSGCWWSELSDVRPQLRQDVVWLLWRLALCIADASDSSSLQAYVKASLFSYKRLLAKTRMPSRQNLLLYAYACLTKRGVRKTCSTEDPLIVQAAQAADTFFEEVLLLGPGHPNHPKHPTMGQLNTFENNHDSGNNNGNNHLCFEDRKASKTMEKMRMLRYVTYVDPIARLSMETERDSRDARDSRDSQYQLQTVIDKHNNSETAATPKRESREKLDRWLLSPADQELHHQQLHHQQLHHQHNEIPISRASLKGNNNSDNTIMSYRSRTNVKPNPPLNSNSSSNVHQNDHSNVQTNLHTNLQTQLQTQLQTKLQVQPSQTLNPKPAVATRPSAIFVSKLP